jgi:hypothetical protein
MPRVTWPLLNDRPSVGVVLMRAGWPTTFTLLADTGAGSNKEVFDLILAASACQLCGTEVGWDVSLSGAYSGRYPLFDVRVQIPALRFDANLLAVGVPALPEGFEGTACFRFLNRFAYGNFGDPSLFGLET